MWDDTSVFSVPSEGTDPMPGTMPIKTTTESLSFIQNESDVSAARQLCVMALEDDTEIVTHWMESISQPRKVIIDIVTDWSRKAIDAGIVQWIKENVSNLRQSGGFPFGLWSDMDGDSIAEKIDTSAVFNYRFLSSFLKKHPMRVQSGNLTCEFDMRYIALLSCAILGRTRPSGYPVTPPSRSSFDMIFDYLCQFLGKIRDRQLKIQASQFRQLPDDDTDEGQYDMVDSTLEIKAVDQLYAAAIQTLYDVKKPDESKSQQEWLKYISLRASISFIEQLHAPLIQRACRNVPIALSPAVPARWKQENFQQENSTMDHKIHAALGVDLFRFSDVILSLQESSVDMPVQRAVLQRLSRLIEQLSLVCINCPPNISVRLSDLEEVISQL